MSKMLFIFYQWVQLKRFCHEKWNQSILVCVPCSRRSSVRAARGLMIMINCQSVQGDNHHGWCTFIVLGWLLAWWTPYQNDHRTPLDFRIGIQIRIHHYFSSLFFWVLASGPLSAKFSLLAQTFNYAAAQYCCQTRQRQWREFYIGSIMYWSFSL